MGSVVGPALVVSAHPEMRDGHSAVCDAERRGFRKSNEIKGLRGRVLRYAAETNPQIDGELAENAHFGMKKR
jgi:hypothetical protein